MRTHTSYFNSLLIWRDLSSGEILGAAEVRERRR